MTTSLLPANALKAEARGLENGWMVTTRRVWVGHTDQPPGLPSTAIVFAQAEPRVKVWAIWKGGNFWRSFASTAQRLGYGDLLEVLADPAILTDVDPDNPFGNTNDGLPDNAS